MPDTPPTANTTSDSQWQSTTTLESIAQWLLEHNDILLVTHNKPDGDAIGSALAVARALRLAKPAARVEILLAGPMDHWVQTLAADTPFHIAEDDGTCPALEGFTAAAILIQDTGTRGQLAGVWPWLEGRAADAAIVDHHRSGDADIADRRVIDTTWAAICQASAHLAAHILKLASPRDLPLAIAEPAFLGLATDTGWFRHSNVTPATLRLAADLLEIGVDHPCLLALTEHRDRPSRLHLKARALDSIEFLDDDRIAIMRLRAQDFADAHADTTESGGFTDDALRVDPVRVAALITEVPNQSPPIAKLSLRSKAGEGMIDVNAIAQTLGGGGHANAAGARVEGTIDHARDQLLAALRNAMQAPTPASTP